MQREGKGQREARLDRQKKNTSYIHIASSLREIEGVNINIDIAVVHKFTAIKSISTDSSSNCIFFYLNCNCDFCKDDLFPNLLWPQFFNRPTSIAPNRKESLFHLYSICLFSSFKFLCLSDPVDVAL